MVARYDWKYDGMDDYPNGAYVEYHDYAALEARVAELEKDAARYRWLRDIANHNERHDIKYMSHEEMDKHIDSILYW